MGEWDGWQGWTEKVALSLGTVPGLKDHELLLSFNAFRNDAKLEVLTHGDDGADDGRRFIGTSADLLDEGFVNLEDIDGKLLKVTEAGIAGAEIIQGNVNPY